LEKTDTNCKNRAFWQDWKRIWIQPTTTTQLNWFLLCKFSNQVFVIIKLIITSFFLFPIVFPKYWKNFHGLTLVVLIAHFAYNFFSANFKLYHTVYSLSYFCLYVSLSLFLFLSLSMFSHSWSHSISVFLSVYLSNYLYPPSLSFLSLFNLCVSIYLLSQSRISITFLYLLSLSSLYISSLCRISLTFFFFLLFHCHRVLYVFIVVV
jgi:hypothetical protein